MKVRDAALSLVMLAVVALVPACSHSSSSVTPDQFEQHLMARDQFTRPQAACVRKIVFSRFNPAGIKVLQEQGLAHLSPELWSIYIYAMVSCDLHDELIKPVPSPGATTTTTTNPPTNPPTTRLAP